MPTVLANGGHVWGRRRGGRARKMVGDGPCPPPPPTTCTVVLGAGRKCAGIDGHRGREVGLHMGRAEKGRGGVRGGGGGGGTSCMMRSSSSSVHSSLRTDGQRWLCQRSRACLPRRAWLGF